MLVPRILSELDAQLERLQTARDTIASLIAPTPVKRRRASLPKSVDTAEVMQSAAAAETAAGTADPTVSAVQDTSAEAVAPVRRRGRPKGSVNRRPSAPRARAAHAPEPTALARVVASGPVFVSAAELERRRARAVEMAAPKVEEPTVFEGTLDALIREVAERRSSAAA